ncbi:MAG: HAMP domain-containing histidine kinase [Prevotella sp.]|nr:HAMP domain-containing histidine kinase [Prevotella sp.]
MMWMVILVIILVLALLACLVYVNAVSCKMKAIRKADRMKQAFLLNINHEIRTPLKSLAGLSDMVSKEDLYLSKNDKRNIADQMRYSANLIGTLIDEVMMFSDCSQQGHTLTFESFSPNALCRRCLEGNMNSIYHRQAVQLNFKRELSDEYFVRNDRHLVELIINKLVLNACRFTEEGEVLVGCNTSEQIGRLTIFVEDTGEGVPEHRLNNLFSWFEEPDDMNDEAELDLSICHRVAEQIGGTLYMDSHYQRRGTRMVLTLPIR